MKQARTDAVSEMLRTMSGALEKNPNGAWVIRIEMARLAHAMGDDSVAYDQLHKSLLANPSQPQVRLELAQGLFSMGRYADIESLIIEGAVAGDTSSALRALGVRADSAMGKPK